MNPLAIQSSLPKLLLIGEFSSLNGGERSMLAIIPFLRSRWSLSAAVPIDGEFATALRDSGVEIVEFNLKNVSGERLSLTEIRESLCKTIEAVSPQTIHAISLSTSRIAGPVAKQLRIPCLGHLRDILKLSKQVIADLNQNCRLLAVSQATADWHIRQGLNETRVNVLWNGVDLDHFRPRISTGSLNRELGIDAGDSVVLTIGQIGMRKGLETLLSSAEIICHETTDVHFVIAGQRFSEKDEAVKYESDLHERSQKGSLTGRVHFLGYRPDVVPLLNEATLLLHTARQEPLGRVLLEAAASGLPVVATNVGGTVEIFPAENEAAFVVAVDDPEKTSQAVLRLLREPLLRKSMQQNGRRRMENFFSAQQCANGVLEHYDAIRTL